MIRHNCFNWVTGSSAPLWFLLKGKKKKRFVSGALILCAFVAVYFVSSDSLRKCPRYVNATLTDPFPPCVCLAVWTAVIWVMTAMRPTLAAYPACLTAHHLSPGATASPALDFKQATPHLPLVDTRGLRLLPSTRPIRCHPAAPAASAARLALSSSKGWTLMTSSLVT